MAFLKETGNTNPNNSNNDAWKAQAFLNFFIEKPDGSKTKIGAIPLKDSRKFDSALIKRLQEDGAVQAMMDVMVVDFQLVDDGKVPELGF